MPVNQSKSRHEAKIIKVERRIGMFGTFIRLGD
jgi:hypothetical protein